MAKMLHSYWAYLVLFMMVIATANALIKFFGKKEYEARDFRLALFTLIVTHIQLLLAIVLWFIQDYFSENTVKEIMGNSALRANAVEHPFVGILTVIFITIGYSKHKKGLTSSAKLKPLAIFYSIALLLVLSRIPWSTWL